MTDVSRTKKMEIQLETKIHSVIVCVLLFLIITPAIGQICDEKYVNATPDYRYTNNFDGTITDHKTNLVWKQCSEGLSTSTISCDTGSISVFNWQAALRAALSTNNTGFAGYFDWRLPNRKELASLVIYQCNNPSINLSMFPNTASLDYWSSTQHVNNPTFSWWINFDFGSLRYGAKNIARHVRLVRGGS